METKRNKKYFTQKGLSLTAIIGIVLFAVGIILYFTILESMAVLFIIFAIVCWIFSLSSTAKETDIDYAVSEKIKDLDERAMIRYEVYEKDFLKIVDPAKLFGYDYVSEGVFFKHGGDGKNRTSMYNAIQLFYTDNKLYVHGRRFSLIDDTIDEEFGDSYRYVDLDHAEYETREMHLPKDRKVTYNVFNIVDNNGKAVISVSVSYGADVDKTIDEINHVINLKKRDAGLSK